ncbi:MAG: RNA polymerase sigma factor [Planctomycetota bacterium]
MLTGPASDPPPASPWGLAGETAKSLLREKLLDVVREGGEGCDARELLGVLDDGEIGEEARRDLLATQLMETFRLTGSRAAFGLLYELSGQPLLQQVASRLRRYQSTADPQDVLQEVFVNIYRYPHRFRCERDDAFRVWTSTIVRNTVLKHLRSLSRSGRAEVAFDDLPEPPAPYAGEPSRGVIEGESEAECRRIYVTYLFLYLRFFSMLSDREQRAIHLVEVEGSSYRAAARELGIKLENLKMVIFRARRKIHRSMKRVFEGLPPDVRPARDPRAAETAGSAVAPEAFEETPAPLTRKVATTRSKRPRSTCAATERPAPAPLGTAGASEDWSL